MRRDASMIASDPDISAWVAANAGAGKTYTLANRVARLRQGIRVVVMPSTLVHAGGKVMVVGCESEPSNCSLRTTW